MKSFLDFPSEIRTIIIDHAASALSTTLIHPDCLEPRVRERRSRRRDRWTKRSPCPSLLLVCLSVYEESLEPVYARTVVRLCSEDLSPDLQTRRPGMNFVKAVDFYINACFPKGCVSYSEAFASQVASDVRSCLPQVTSIGLSIRDNNEWMQFSQPISAYTLEQFLGDPSWSSFIHRISLKIDGRNRYALQAFLQSSRISDPKSLSVTKRRRSILSVPYAFVWLPVLEELELNMVAMLTAPGQDSSDPDPIMMQRPKPHNGKTERYTASDSLIHDRQNRDFVIALKMNDLFHAAGKDVRIYVKRWIWTEGYGGYVVEEKSLQQSNCERWESSTDFVSDYNLRGKN